MLDVKMCAFEEYLGLGEGLIYVRLKGQDGKAIDV